MEMRVVESPVVGRKPAVSLSEDNSTLIGPFSSSAGWVSPLFSEKRWCYHREEKKRISSFQVIKIFLMTCDSPGMGFQALGRYCRSSKGGNTQKSLW